MKPDADGGYFKNWRLQHALKRDGNLYPTHGLGPIAQCMNINRGDRFEYTTSLSSAEFGLSLYSKAEHPEFTGENFKLGDMNTTLTRTANGKSILVQHDTTSPRPYSRIHLLSGTKGVIYKWPRPARIALEGNGNNAHQWLDETQQSEIESKYAHPLAVRIGEEAKKVGGHGGMDFIMDVRLIHCLRNGLALDQDVYDAAAWSVIAPLSEWSVANRSDSIEVPDFTRGSWKNNKPLGIVT